MLALARIMEFTRIFKVSFIPVSKFDV